MSECKWLFKVGDRVVVTDDTHSGDDGWNTKIFGVEGEVVEVDELDPGISYRIRLDTQHPDMSFDPDRRYWFREPDLQAVRDA